MHRRDYLRDMSDQARAQSHPPQTPLLAERIVHLARLASGGTGEDSLTPAQWTALRYFDRANSASRTPSAFSEFHATTRGTASQTVKSLILMGLLERHISPTDRRSVRIDVTPSGRNRLQQDPLGALDTAIAALGPEDQRQLDHLLARLTQAIARNRNAPLFGRCGECSHCDTASGPAYCRCTHSLLEAAEMEALCVDFSPVPKLR
jgi:DNA-binding MarR family transcriptional regulator